MRIRMLVGCLVILALTLPARGWAGPVITFDKEQHDFGKMFSGETKSVTFQVSNAGDEKLVIKRVRTSCGCTKTIHGSKELEPKAKTEIVASLDTMGMKAGKKKKIVTVYSNDPKRSKAELALLAEVIQELKIEPTSLAIRLGKYVEEVSFPAKIWNDSDRPVKLTGIELLNSPLVEGKLNPEKLTIEPGTSKHLSIDLKLKKREGKNFYLGSLRVKSDHPREKEIGLNYLVHFQSTD